MKSYLLAATFLLPDSDQFFTDQLFTLFEIFGTRKEESITFNVSKDGLIPLIAISSADVSCPSVDFDLGDHHLRIPITNTSGREKESPEVYSAIHLGSFIERIGSATCQRLDHVGFNLPWFDGVHPEIVKLRSALVDRCAYYRFPTGEGWDFILPATQEEIDGETIDLALDRHPKIEIVSFEKSSTPMIQIDFSITLPFEEIVSRFPESIVDRELKNVWIYIQNPYGIDLCFVVGEYQKGDWSEFFAGHRLC